MRKLPDVLFVIDPRKEEIAISEAKKLNIPVVALTDTNCSPVGIEHLIPGNDDAIRAIRLITSQIANAVLEGKGESGEDISNLDEMETAMTAEPSAVDEHVDEQNQAEQAEQA
ncbi:MAG: 30S ribosomal protein S2, partial [Candidatus Electrothrix sp. AUS3]|nr:30S ribosomal protein S2 [Candidatus Electrothrix gigas]